MTTFKNLTPGTVISYADSANYLREAVVINHFEDRWGAHTMIIWKENNKREDIASHHKLDRGNYTGWNIVATPEY